MKTREEQIEEMAKAIYATGVALDGTDYAFGVHDNDDHFHRMANALIAANIGDVTAHEAETEYWKTICKIEGDEHHAAIKNAAEHARHLMQERDEYKHRTEVAERALLTACVNFIKDEEGNVNMELLARVVYTNFLRKAEKELAEEQR